MKSIVLYIDGTAQTRKGFHLGWGIIACTGNDVKEVTGGMTVKKHFSNYHEDVAFAEAVLYANSIGFQPRHMSIYTDYQMLAWAPFGMHPGNYAAASSYTVTIKERLRLLCKEHYSHNKGLYKLLIATLEQARITWIKGHANCVYNLRADYLAGFAGRVHSGRYSKDKEMLPFDQWAGYGFHYGHNLSDTYADNPGLLDCGVAWIPPFIPAKEKRHSPGVDIIVKPTIDAVVVIPANPSVVRKFFNRVKSSFLRLGRRSVRGHRLQVALP